MTNKQAYAGLLERLVAEASLLDQPACTLTKGKSQVSQAGDACREAAEAIASLLKRAGELEGALAPFAAMGRVMEIRARVTFGKMPPDSKIVCESSGEAGIGILTMGHFRDASALLPKAPGWAGVYQPPFNRAALNSDAPLSIGEI